MTEVRREGLGSIYSTKREGKGERSSEMREGREPVARLRFAPVTTPTTAPSPVAGSGSFRQPQVVLVLIVPRRSLALRVSTPVVWPLGPPPPTSPDSPCARGPCLTLQGPGPESNRSLVFPSITRGILTSLNLQDLLVT